MIIVSQPHVNNYFHVYISNKEMDVVRTRESEMGSPDCGAIGPNEAAELNSFGLDLMQCKLNRGLLVEILDVVFSFLFRISHLLSRKDVDGLTCCC